MKVHHGLQPPVERTPRYNFDQLKHGDAIEVDSVSGAREMFRRWKAKTGRAHVRLTGAREKGKEKFLFFIDATAPALDDVV
jgi:uncharacterized protein (DUF1684 family)